MNDSIAHPDAWALALIMIWPTLFSVGLFPLVVVAYVFRARRDERRMVAEFGEPYRAYRRQVSMFLPRAWAVAEAGQPPDHRR